MSDYFSFDSPDNELRDDEYPDEPVEDDDTDTYACPHCGAEVYDNAVQCPVCGDYITASESPLAGWPVWWLALGVAGVVAAVLVLVGLLGG